MSLLPVMARGASSPPSGQQWSRPSFVAASPHVPWTSPNGFVSGEDREKSCPASSPAINRIPVPELPQSMGPNGSVNPHMPLPWTVNESGVSSIRTPSDWKAHGIQTIFAATIGLHGARPSAKAVGMMARWVTDLSPGR